MADLSRVVVQLQAQRKLLLKDLHQLENAIGVLKTLGRNMKASPGSRLTGRPRRKMSAAGRRRIAAAQRARWAKFKREKRAK
jgi:hypothetical protein